MFDFPAHDELFNLMLLRAATRSKSVEATATGNPLTFVTDLARPLKSLLIPFTPQQSGTGDPSPSNIRSILPWNGLTVFGGGKNLLNPTNYVFNTITSRGLTFEVQSDGSVKVTGTTESSDFGPTLSVRFQLPAGTYYGYKDDGNVYVAYRKSTSEEGGVTTGLVSPFTLDGSEWVYCNIYVRNPGTFDTILHPQIARENTQTAYEPYKHITDTDIVFQSPVYGGEHEAVSGKLLNDYEGHVTTWGAIKGDRYQSGYRQGVITFENEIPVSGQSGSGGTNQKCNIAKYQWDDFNGTSHFYTAEQDGAYVARILLPDDTPDETEIVVIAKLKTPVEIQLTPAQITAIIGNNTIWSDADGSMTAVYLKKKG